MKIETKARKHTECIERSTPFKLPNEYAAIVFFDMVKTFYEKIYGVPKRRKPYFDSDGNIILYQESDAQNEHNTSLRL